MIDVRRMRALQELSDRGTIAAAAEALQLTPSAVSQQLAALERDVGERLVVPSGRRVRLTPAAEVVLQHAGVLFAQLERLRSDLDAHAQGAAGTVRVTAFPSAIRQLVAPAVLTLAGTAPGVRLVVSEAEAPEGFERLARHESDVAIGMEGPHAPRPDDPRLARVDLCRDVFDVALPADHPRAGAASVALASLASDVWVAPPPGWQCESVFLGACRRAGFSPDAVHRTTDWQAALALVGAGLGTLLIPRLAQATAPPGTVVRPLAGEAPCRHVFAACRRGTEDAPPIRNVLEAIVDVARSAASRPVLAAA